MKFTIFLGALFSTLARGGEIRGGRSVIHQRMGMLIILQFSLRVFVMKSFFLEKEKAAKN